MSETLRNVTIDSLILPTKKWDPRKSVENKLISYIDISSVDREKKCINEPGRLLCHEAPSRARQIVKTNDVLVSTVRPNLNAVASVPSCYDGATASTGFTVLRPDKQQLDARYLYHWVRTPIFVTNMVQLATGANYPAVSDSVVKSSQIPIPLNIDGSTDVVKQKYIAAILDKADAIRRKRREAIALTEEFLRSAFLDMFGDPVTNPKGWEVAVLADVTDSKLGKMLSKAARKGINPVPYLGNSHVRWRQFDLSELPEMDFSEDELIKLNLQNGDLLVCEGGEVGRCAIWRDQMQKISFQKALHRVRCNLSKVTPEYLQEYFVMMAERGGLARSTSTATIAHLTGVRLKKLPVLLPPMELQRRFQEVYAKLQDIQSKYTEDMTNNLFNSLVQRAFRGQLRAGFEPGSTGHEHIKKGAEYSR